LPQTYHDNPSSFFQWLQQCSQSLDWFNIMSYDYHGAFDDPVKIGTGVNSPLVQDKTPNGPFSIKQTVKAYLGAGISANKMVLGMPTYGRSYIVANPSQLASNSSYGQQFTSAGPAGPATQVPGVLAYYEIMQQIAAGVDPAMGQCHPHSLRVQRNERPTMRTRWLQDRLCQRDEPRRRHGLVD
jgi:chitinase